MPFLSILFWPSKIGLASDELNGNTLLSCIYKTACYSYATYKVLETRNYFNSFDVILMSWTKSIIEWWMYLSWEHAIVNHCLISCTCSLCTLVVDMFTFTECTALYRLANVLFVLFVAGKSPALNVGKLLFINYYKKEANLSAQCKRV